LTSQIRDVRYDQIEVLWTDKKLAAQDTISYEKMSNLRGHQFETNIEDKRVFLPSMPYQLRYCSLSMNMLDHNEPATLTLVSESRMTMSSLYVFGEPCVEAISTCSGGKERLPVNCVSIKIRFILSESDSNQVASRTPLQHFIHFNTLSTVTF